MNQEPTLRLGFFLGFLILLSLLEILRPKRALREKKIARWLTNLGLVLIDSVLVRLLLGFTLYSVGQWGLAKGWGIMHWLSFPSWLNFILGFLILDLFIYLQHIVFHYVPFLWRLHRVHHTDLDLDVSSGVRFHPLEILPSLLLKAGVVLIFGIDPWPALIFEIVLNVTSLFTHTNVRIHLSLDKWIRRIFVTPDMHRIHHTPWKPQTNSNFGFNFSWWDRLFRTYRAQPRNPQETMELGIDEFRNGKKLYLDRLLIQPFGKI